MGSGIGFFLMMIMMLGGNPNGPNDLLDMVPSEIYWQSKGVTPSVEQLERDAGPEKAVAADAANKLVAALGSDDFKAREDARKQLEAMGGTVLPLLKPAMESKDPEVAAAAAELSKKIASHGKQREIRRLMAIRTLGEIQSKASLPTLKLLTESKELFVADYAVRAMAQIEGKPLPKVDNRKRQLEDLKLLPKDVGIVGQISGMVGPAMTVDKIAEIVGPQVAKNAAMMQGMRLGNGAQAPADAPDPKKLQSRILSQVLALAESVGNVRVDGMTMGVAENVGPNNGWVIMVFRGKGDSAAFVQALKAIPNPGQREEIKSSRDGNIEIVEMGHIATFIFPSNEQVIFVSGPGAEKVDEPAKGVVAILKGGKGEFESNEEIAALMKKVDPLAPMWAVGKLNAQMQKSVPPFAGVDTFTLSTKQGKGSLAFTVTGQGSDEAGLKASADAMAGAIQAGIGMAKVQAEETKAAGAAVTLLESMKVTSEGKTATMTGEVKPDIVQFILAKGPWSWMLARPEREETGVEGPNLPPPQP